MKTIILNSLVIVFVIFGSQQSYSQGFVNLNFESANVPVIPFGQFGADVSSTQGVPGWITYVGGGQVNSILHNNVPIGTAAISIFGPQWFSTQILEGSYSIEIAGSSAGTPTGASIGQTAQIPQNTKTITFFASQGSSLSAMFAGQIIPLVQIGTGANYYILGGDVSTFAGQTGELRFVAAANTGGILDNIQFSTQSIPEPTGLALFSLGALLLGFFRRRNSSR